MTDAEAGGRVEAIDVVRGVALLGVLLVNVVTEFRVSLLDWLLHFHVGPRGPVSDWVDVFIATFVEMKAFAVFSLLFGVGLGVQAEQRGPGFGAYVMRRQLALLAIGLVHVIFVWNGDILVEYAVVGALVAPLVRGSLRRLFVGAAGMLVLSALPFLNAGALPDDAHILAARVAYGDGGWRDAVVFRMEELRFLLPLHLSVMPRTAGLMALGAWTWRVGVWRGAHRSTVVTVAVLGSGVGVLMSGWGVWWALHGTPAGALWDGLAVLSSGLGYAAAALFFAHQVRRLAPLGRMALTNYLGQSVVWTVLFSGFGYYYRLDSATVFGLGLLLYAVQAWGSAVWLRRFRYGPVEWAWRCVTYGRAMGLRR